MVTLVLVKYSTQLKNSFFIWAHRLGAFSVILFISFYLLFQIVLDNGPAAKKKHAQAIQAGKWNFCYLLFSMPWVYVWFLVIYFILVLFHHSVVLVSCCYFFFSVCVLGEGGVYSFSSSCPPNYLD